MDGIFHEFDALTTFTFGTILDLWVEFMYKKVVESYWTEEIMNPETFSIWLLTLKFLLYLVDKPAGC